MKPPTPTPCPRLAGAQEALAPYADGHLLVWTPTQMLRQSRVMVGAVGALQDHGWVYHRYLGAPALAERVRIARQLHGVNAP